MEYRPSLKRKVAGFSLLFLGAIGTVLPVLQGFLFIALGLFVLRDQYAWAHRGMEWLRSRWPRQVQGVEAMEARMVAWFRRQGERLRLPRGGGGRR
jgi:putative transmembrane protein PGPGW